MAGNNQAAAKCGNDATNYNNGTLHLVEYFRCLRLFNIFRVVVARGANALSTPGIAIVIGSTGQRFELSA